MNQDISSMLRVLVAIVVAVVVWLVAATLGNMLLRAALPGYGAVEASMAFTLAMQVGRLAVGVLSTFAAGLACSAVARGKSAPVYVFAVLLLLCFVPVHYGLWARFPVWYHVVFLGSLVPVVLLGAVLHRRIAGSAPVLI
jgi:hypothetical protein